MAKVFVSVLGTTDYVPCTYFTDDFEVENVRFVQEATIKRCCHDWRDEDRIIIFTTPDAYRQNWLDDGHTDPKTRRKLEREGLKRRLESMDISAQVLQVDIPEGKTEQEIWDIFTVIFNEIKERDEVIFDITHAFRSIPMLAIVVLNYAKVIKNVTLEGIFYGAFEVLVSIQEAKKIPLEKRRVPIFDLTAFDRLMAWAIAVDRFGRSGDATLVSELAQKTVTPLLTASGGEDARAKTIRKIAKQMVRLSEAVSTCRGPEISRIVEGLKEQINKYETVELDKPFRPILDRIKQELEDFGKNEISDGINAAKWCLDHNLIQQGYTILQETLITFIIRKVSGDPPVGVNRDIASQAAKIYFDNTKEGDWREPAKSGREFTKKCLKIFRSHDGLAKILRGLGDLRNDLNHAGYRDHPTKAATFKKRLEDLISSASALDIVSHP